MNEDKLFEMIDENLENIQTELDIMIDKNKHLGKVLSNNKCLKNIDVLQIDLLDIICAYLSINTEELSYLQIKEIIKNNIDLTESKNESLLENLENLFLYQPSQIVKKQNVEIYKNLDLINLKVLFDEFKAVSIFQLFRMVIHYKIIKNKYIKRREHIMLNCNNSKQKKQLCKEIDNNINDNIAITKLLDICKDMIIDITTEYENENLKIKKIKTRINNYKKAKTLLNNLNLEKTIITEQWIDNILDLIYSKNARREFLCQIGTYQKTKFNRLLAKLNNQR